MKTITSALVALLLIAGIAGTASALDAKSFYEQVDRDHYWSVELTKRRMTMKIILSALVALSVIASVAGSASALDAKTFFEQVDRDHN
jgi:fumarate reductase subunit C